MGEKDLRVSRPEDFNRYWDKVLKTVEECSPQVWVTKWEQEDPNFAGAMFPRPMVAGAPRGGKMPA